MWRKPSKTYSHKQTVSPDLEKPTEHLNALCAAAITLESYTQEIKFRSSRIKTDRDLQTNVASLYATGNAAGLSESITGVGATGIIAARGLLGGLGSG